MYQHLCACFLFMKQVIDYVRNSVFGTKIGNILYERVEPKLHKIQLNVIREILAKEECNFLCFSFCTMELVT